MKRASSVKLDQEPRGPIANHFFRQQKMMSAANREPAVAQHYQEDLLQQCPKVNYQRNLMSQVNSSPHVVMQRMQLDKGFGEAVQRQEDLEDEELLQGKFKTVQRQEDLEEEELLQGKFETAQRQEDLEDEELLQGKFETVQRQEDLEEEELLQGKFIEEEEEPLQGKISMCESPMQLQEETTQRENRTGMPDHLKAGVESLSGIDMSDVRVHYNSSKPAQLNALAYAQGKDIHLGSGQEQHLAHEAWHVVQQREGKVKPTMQMAGEQINDDVRLENDADVMGGRALQAEVGVKDTDPLTDRAMSGRDGKIKQHKKIPLQRTRWTWDAYANPAAWTAQDTVYNQGLPQTPGKYHGDYYDDGVTANIIPTPTCAYEIHGDKHFKGQGSQWVGQKTTVNNFIEKAILASKGAIYLNANLVGNTLYYLQVTTAKVIGRVKIAKTRINKCPKTKTYLVQITYNRANNTLTYHGYPIKYVNNDGLGFSANQTGAL